MNIEGIVFTRWLLLVYAGLNNGNKYKIICKQKKITHIKPCGHITKDNTVSRLNIRVRLCSHHWSFHLKMQILMKSNQVTLEFMYTSFSSSLLSLISFVFLTFFLSIYIYIYLNIPVFHFVLVKSRVVQYKNVTERLVCTKSDFSRLNLWKSKIISQLRN